MSRGEYAAGMAFFVPTLGCVLGAAWQIASRRLGPLPAAMRATAFGVLATAILIAVHVLPGALYVLSREAVLATAAIALAAAWRLTRVPASAGADFPPPSSSATGHVARWLAPVAAVGVGGFCIWLMVVVWQYRYHQPAGIDTLSFHLPTVAGWIQSGTIWRVDDFIPDLFFGNYPNNGDVVLLSTLLPWRNDFLTHFAIYPFVVLTALASYCLARELRAPAPVAALLGVAVASIPVVAEPALNNALPDAVLFATFAAGLAFLVRHHRTGDASLLVVAGIALGTAFGAKWYGVSCVTVVCAVWAIARLRGGRGLPAVAREGAVLGGLVTLTGGVWLLRNWILSGNPVYPLKIAPLGVTIFDAPPDRLRDVVGSSIASYFDDPSVWKDVLAHQYRLAAAGAGLLLALGVPAALAMAGRQRHGRRRDPDTGLVLAGVVLVVLLVAVYTITPYSALGPDGDPVLAGANVRYVVPALIVGVGLLGWAGAAARRPTVLLVLEVLLLVAIYDGLRTSGVTGPRAVLASFAAALVVVLALLAVRGRIPRGRRHLGPGARRLAVGAAAALAVLALALGDRYQDTFNRLRFSAGVDPALAWIDANAPTGRRIGLAGVWTDRGLAPVYPAHGPRLRNEVVYNGPRVRELLRRWGRREPFVAQLEREDLDLLIVGRGTSFEQFLAGDRRLVVPEVREERWARSAGFREILRSDRLILFAAPGFFGAQLRPRPLRASHGGESTRACC